MKTVVSTLHQNRELQSPTSKKILPAVAASVNEVPAMLGAVSAAAVIVLLSVWVSGLEMTGLLGAGVWGIGFIFLGFAVDNRDPGALLQLATGVALLVLAWLQTSVSPDFAIVSGMLVATWVAVGLFKQLR